MGMYKEMYEKKAKPAYKETRSNRVVKRIPRAEIVALNKSMEPIARRNALERKISWEHMRNIIVGGK